MLHAVFGQPQGKDIIEFISILKSERLEVVDYLFIDFRKADLRYSEDEKSDILEHFSSIVELIQPSKWVIVISSGHTLTNFIESTGDFFANRKSSLKLFDMNDMNDAYEYINIDGVENELIAFLADMQKKLK